ncbi:MAG TPA: TA system VapC family ribonuclease toxin [Acidimicrobiales bacterium]|nr:TA system VapC family ribonuclease toxin [Acidimicrobiales bacterium]
MILPDVNVLVYAFRREAHGHDLYASWLAEVVRGAEELALVDASLLGFLRIVTNRRIFATPAPTDLALDFVTRLRNGARSRWLPTGAPSWDRLDQLVAQDRGIAGNLVPDAHLAALALAHGCRLATADRGFARFPGLAWFDPAA